MTARNEPVGPRPLRAVPDPGDGYTDWEAVYQDNATWVYRTMFARVGNRPTPKTSPPRSSLPPCGRCD